MSDWVSQRALSVIAAFLFATALCGCVATPWPSPGGEEGGVEDGAEDVVADVVPADACTDCDVVDAADDGGLGEDAPEPDVPGPDVPEPDVPELPDPTGILEGKVVTQEGAPVGGSSVLACNHSMCFTGSALEDGTFVIDQLDEGSYKVQVMGSLQGFMNMAFNAEVFQDQTTVISRDIVLVEIVEEKAPLLEDDGGTLMVAEGAVEFTAEPGSLDYPLGFDEAMHGVGVPISALPPHNVEPWLDAPEGAAAFHFNPFGTEADPALAFRVLSGLLPDTSHGVWVVETKLGKLEKLGVVTTDAEGVLQSDGAVPGLAVLSTLVLVPETPGEPSP